jgi:hypothetical protein
MAKQIPANEQMTDLVFPTGGVNVATELETQPAQTTPFGKNVRVYEPGTLRARGGSRPGLSEYIPSLVTGSAGKIQDLATVVMTDANATNGSTVVDNSPTRNLRGGNRGFAPVRHTIKPPNRFSKGSKSPMVVYQSGNLINGNQNMADTVPMGGNANLGDLIVVVVAGLNLTATNMFQPDTSQYTVSDSLQNSYTQIGSLVSLSFQYQLVNSQGQVGVDNSGFQNLAMFYTIVKNAGPYSVSVTDTNNVVEFGFTVYELSNPNPSPLDAFVFAAVKTGSPSTNWSLTVPVSGKGEAVILGFCSNFYGPASGGFDAPAIFPPNFQDNPGTPCAGGIDPFVQNGTGASVACETGFGSPQTVGTTVSTNISSSLSPVLAQASYVAIGASFKPKGS